MLIGLERQHAEVIPPLPTLLTATLLYRGNGTVRTVFDYQYTISIQDNTII